MKVKSDILQLTKHKRQLHILKFSPKILLNNFIFFCIFGGTKVNETLVFTGSCHSESRDEGEDGGVPRQQAGGGGVSKEQPAADQEHREILISSHRRRMETE